MAENRVPPQQQTAPASPGRRFTAGDAVAAGFYLLFVVVFSFVPVVLPGPLAQDPLVAAYAVNLTFYLAAAALAWFASRRAVVTEIRLLAARPVLTAAAIPAAVILMLLVTMVAVVLAGPADTAVNQQAAQELVTGLPPLLVIPMVVVLAPFVEEYIYRHLLIGKLSRYVNIWICAAASVLLFAGIHIMGKEDLTLPVLAPYLAMGLVLVAVYLWAGRNFMLSYAVHAAKNLLAVLLTYAVPAELLQQ